MKIIKITSFRGETFMYQISFPWASTSSVMDAEPRSKI